MSPTFSSTEDIQLWHTRVGEYQIPYYCQPVIIDGLQKGYHCKIAVSCNPSTYRRASAEMDNSCVWQTVEGWILTEAVFLAMFTKADGITPGYYYKKWGAAVDLREEEIAIMQSDFDQHELAPESSKSFIEDLHAKSQLDQLPVLKALWNAICNHIAFWLLVKGEPIDFGWFKLHAFPVRANWKQIVLSRHPKLTSISRLVDAEDRMDAIETAGVAATLQETTLISLRGDHAEKRVGWTIEVEPTRAWDDYTDALELHRLGHTAGGSDYPSWWGNTWYKLRDSAVSVLLRFASQSAIPAATLGQGGYRSRSGFVEHVPKGCVRPANVDDCEVRAVVPDGPAAVRLPDGSIAGLQETRRLPKMPNLRLGLPDLRKSRRNGPKR